MPEWSVLWVVVPKIDADGTDDDKDSRNTYPAEPWIHEWQHTLQPLGTMCGRIVADPDEGDAHGYKNEDTGLPINGFWKFCSKSYTLD